MMATTDSRNLLECKNYICAVAENETCVWKITARNMYNVKYMFNFPSGRAV
jgi:hypothetical protein